MTWTYTGDPASSDRDAVRFLIGDTDGSDQLSSDEEIAFALTEGGSVYVAGALVCDAIASRFARDVDTRVGSASESCSQRSKQYSSRARELRRLGSTYVLPRFGGLSISEKETLASDSDAVAPFFNRDMTDNPNAPNRWGTNSVDDDDS